MSTDAIAIVVTTAIFAVFFAWVPLLNVICPPCGRFLERRRSLRNSQKEKLPLGAMPTKR
jgi:hypothetical protein